MIKSKIHKRNVSSDVKKIVAYNQSYKCAACERLGVDQLLPPTYEVDHVIPLHMGGTNEIGNLEALCNSCHAQKTQYERIQRLERWNEQDDYNDFDDCDDWKELNEPKKAKSSKHSKSKSKSKNESIQSDNPIRSKYFENPQPFQGWNK